MRSVLIVEDDKIVRGTIFDYMVNTERYKPICASNGEAGLKMLVQHSVEAILLDIKMPKVDGVKFLQSLRSIPRMKDLPVLIWSGFAERDDVQELIKLGISGFFKKPVRPKEIVEKLDSILATS